jgi:hypothetical protein
VLWGSQQGVSGRWGLFPFHLFPTPGSVYLSVAEVLSLGQERQGFHLLVDRLGDWRQGEHCIHEEVRRSGGCGESRGPS